jgi:hypothetical protein
MGRRLADYRAIPMPKRNRGNKKERKPGEEKDYGIQLGVAVPRAWGDEIAMHLISENLTASEFLRRAIRAELDRLRV